MFSKQAQDTKPTKNRTRIASLLVVALIVTNAVWAALYFGQSLTCGYQRSRLLAHEELLKQMKAILPVVANGQATWQEVVEATRRNGPREITYETADSVVIGDVTLRFNSANRLVDVQVAPPWDSPPVSAAPASAAPPQSLSYAIYSLPLLYGERQLLAEGMRIYSPADIQVVPGGSRKGNSWKKTLSVTQGFSIGASVYREPKTSGFGLWIHRNGAGFSWEWFVLEEKDVFRKLQGAGRVRVRMNRVGEEEELASVEFLDDVTLRLQEETWWQMLPFVDKETHHLVVRKGSTLWLAP